MDALTAKKDSLRNLNSAVTSGEVTRKAARISRDEILYGKVNGIYDTAKAVKSYVKSIFNSQPQYNQVAAIKFFKPQKA